MAGWIKVHRKLTEWEWYDDINATRLFIHLLLVSNHEDKNWRGIEIKRGQKLTSLDKLSKETKLTVSQIRTCIKKLKSTGELTSKSHSQHTVFTMINYDEYQATDKQIDKPVTNQSQASDKRVTTNKNVKNVKKELDPIVPPETKRSKFKFNDEDLRFANEMFNRILVVNPTADKPNFENWANTLRLMREINKRDHKEMWAVFDWANKDSFWCSNILSPDKLRKQFDRLKVKSNEAHRSDNKQHESSDDGLSDTMRQIKHAREKRDADQRHDRSSMGVNGGNVREMVDQGSWSGRVIDMDNGD